MTVYRRNPLLMTVMGANPGGPAFIVIDSVTGRVAYTKRATGTGGQAIESCAAVAKRLALKNQRSYVIFLDMSRARVGGQVNLSWVRYMGITEEVHPDGSVTRGNPRRQRRPDDAIDKSIEQAWYRLMSGVQVPIMDIPRIFRDVKLEVAAGVPLDQAVLSVGAQYRVNRNPIGEAIVGGLTGALVNRAFQSNPRFEGDPCPACSGPLAFLGSLGNREHYRCRNCGGDFSSPHVPVIRTHGYRKKCGHGIPMRECRVCRGRRVSSLVKPCIHGISGGGPRCVECQRTFRRGGPVRNNPAIRSEWDRLTGRRRLAVLEFAGIPYEQARRLAGRSWSILPPSIQNEVARGWQENPKKRNRKIRKQRLRPVKVVQTTTTQKVLMNPAPRGRRRMTITVEQFAAWVKRQRNPEMWRAFLAKFRGYEKWTHGARARKVHLEWVDTPGVDGLWITYDGGKQPESTYIMPGSSKRKGAWKHPWATMPDIKHDPEAGIVLTKLRGKSRITDFYHK